MPMHHGVACVEIALGPWARPNLALPLGNCRFSGPENGRWRFLQSITKYLVAEVACDAERELGAGFGLNPWSGSMFWAVRGGLGLEAMFTTLDRHPGGALGAK